jgi:hypothetical protein
MNDVTFQRVRGYTERERERDDYFDLGVERVLKIPPKITNSLLPSFLGLKID